MANPLYDMLTGGGPVQNAAAQQTMPQPVGVPRFQNPMQKANYIMQAMRNPAAFVREHLPGLPESFYGDPNRILQYMQQNLGVTQADIQNANAQIPKF